MRATANAEFRWRRNNSQANWINVVRNLGLPAFGTKRFCVRSIILLDVRFHIGQRHQPHIMPTARAPENAVPSHAAQLLQPSSDIAK